MYLMFYLCIPISTAFNGIFLSLYRGTGPLFILIKARLLSIKIAKIHLVLLSFNQNLILISYWLLGIVIIVIHEPAFINDPLWAAALVHFRPVIYSFSDILFTDCQNRL